MEGIKNCPFCGSTGRLTYRAMYYGYMVFVKCDLCGAQGKAVRDFENPEESGWEDQVCLDAEYYWNMRCEQ